MDATNQVAASGGGWVYGRSLASVNDTTLVNLQHMGQDARTLFQVLPSPVLFEQVALSDLRNATAISRRHACRSLMQGVTEC